VDGGNEANFVAANVKDGELSDLISGWENWRNSTNEEKSFCLIIVYH
jgi:hypothetical protein